MAHTLKRWLWGICLAAAVVLLGPAQQAGAQSPTATPPPSAPATAPPPQPTPVPTVDRLAPPPTVIPPTQADDGAQLYWLHCQPCHGDQGQGLTDEWRAQYPVEDQNCWSSGCHGNRPYEDGFTIPATIPAVIGTDSLARFDSAESLHAFIAAAMPFQAPNSLTEDEYLAITAFILRGHDRWDGRPLVRDTLVRYRLRDSAEPTATPLPTPPPEPVRSAAQFGWTVLVVAGAALAAGAWLTRRRASP